MNALRVLAPPRLRPRPHAVNRQVDRPDQHPCRRAPPARRRPPRPRGADQGAAVLSADRKGCRAPAFETYDLSPREQPTSSESRLLWDIGPAVHHHVDRVFNLRRIWIDDVHNSTAIEGNSMTRAHVENLASGARPQRPSWSASSTTRGSSGSIRSQTATAASVGSS